jgi:ethylene receptor
MDRRMPDIDGFEVTARIRKFKSGNRPIIVALTASAEEDLWERCM